MNLVIKQIKNYLLFENAYICYYEGQQECFVVDPGFKSTDVLEELKKNNLNVVSILLTHGHFDHILFSNELRDIYNCPIYVSKIDQELCEDADKNMAHSFFIKNNNVVFNTTTLPENNLLKILNEDIQILTCPGHTLGGVSYYIKERDVVFTGDTLMKKEIGRTDLYGGSLDDIKNTIFHTLFTLPPSVTIYPGHGEVSSIAEEIKTNSINNI